MFNSTYFDASKRTLANYQFDGTATVPFDVIASPERNAARERARWIEQNSGFMKNIDDTIVSNSVGSGLRLNVISENEDFNKEIEELWEEFNAEHIDFYGELNGTDLQRSLLLQRMVDGGIFERITEPTSKKFPFSIQLVEVDNLDESSMYVQDDGFVADGIVFNKSGKVNGYLFKQYVNPLWTNARLGNTFIPRFIKKDDNIIFFKRYDTSRASQRREFTEYARIVNDMKYFMSFQASTVEAASARAKLIYAVESDGMNFDILDDNNQKHEYINGVYTRYLKPNEKLHVVDPAVAGTKYEEFHKNSLRQLAIGRGVSYELAMRDASSANFSSIRASIIQDHKLFDYNQMSLVKHHLDLIYPRFVRQMALSGRLFSVKADDYILSEKNYQKHQWIAPARNWVDPYKDIKALVEKYNLGVITLSDIAKSEGRDIADIIAEKVKENEMMKKAGLIQEPELPTGGEA